MGSQERISKNNKQNLSENRTDKIELVKCPRGGFNCKSHLSEINSFFVAFNEYSQDKEYQQSIISLKKAFDKTFELKASTCLKCADMFRSEITSSLEIVKNDIERMNRGIFRKKNRYAESSILAEKTLKEFADRKAAKSSADNYHPDYNRLGS